MSRRAIFHQTSSLLFPASNKSTPGLNRHVASSQEIPSPILSRHFQPNYSQWDVKTWVPLLGLGPNGKEVFLCGWDIDVRVGTRSAALNPFYARMCGLSEELVQRSTPTDGCLLSVASERTNFTTVWSSVLGDFGLQALDSSLTSVTYHLLFGDNNPVWERGELYTHHGYMGVTCSITYIVHGSLPSTFI